VTTSSPITISLDRRLIEHPQAFHLRRMRAGIWLYLELLARQPAGADSFEVEPATIGVEMGLPEGTVRSWLGHLRKAGYLDAERLNGHVRVTIRRVEALTPPPTQAQPLPADPSRLFTVASLQKALGETGDDEPLQAALNLYPDRVIQRALARTMAVPAERIRRSRTALFNYLLKRHAQDT
jgi:hypothetical protein